MLTSDRARWYSGLHLTPRRAKELAMVGKWFEVGKLYSRGDVRKTLGIDVANMTFLRWEKLKGSVRLIPIKAGGRPFAHVRYEGDNLNEFFSAYFAKQAA